MGGVVTFLDAQADLLARGLSDALRARGLGVPHVDPASGYLTKYRDDPLGYARDVLGLRSETAPHYTSLWAAQRALLLSIAEHQRTLIRGPRKFGKTYGFGVAACWCFTSAPSRVLMFGPTLDHVRDVLWAEVATFWKGAELTLPGKCGVMRAEIDPRHTIVAVPTANPERARGRHAGVQMAGDPDEMDLDVIEREVEALLKSADAGEVTRLLALVDEGQSIPQEVFRILEGALSGTNAKLAIATNPYLGMDDEHEVAHAAKPGSGYHRIKVSALTEARAIQLGARPDPLDADEVFAPVPPRFHPPGWADGEMLAKYDINDPLYQSDVLGRLSEGNIASLVIPRSVLVAALDREPGPEITQRHEGPRMGVDIGESRDKCVAILMVDGEVVAEEEWLPGEGDLQAQVTIAEQIRDLARTWGLAVHRARPLEWDAIPIPGGRISIDDSGMVGVADILAGMGIYVDRVNFGAGAEGQWYELMGDTPCANVRAEMYWAARRQLQEGVARVPERFSRIWQQASWCHFERKMRTEGYVIQIEPKDEIRSQHGRSPDNLDAFVLACRETVVAATMIRSSRW